MEILVSGPFGTIGTSVVARLVEEGHRVTAFDLDTPANRARAATLAPAVATVFGDVTDRASVLAAVRGKEAVVHLAALIPPLSESRPAISEKVNVGGTKNVIDAIAEVAPDARLVFPSSISVHGPSGRREPPCRVEQPFDGRDHYARQKIACEELLRASTIRWVALRIGACADPEDLTKGGSQDDAMGTMFAIAPETRIEYLHPRDAARAIAAACSRPGLEGKVLFLGSGASSQLRWRDFVSTIPRALGLGDFPREWFGTDDYYTDWMDTEESQRLLDYQHEGYPAYVRTLETKFRWPRVLLTPLRPLLRWLLARKVAEARRAHASRGGDIGTTRP